jgi:hypothetical protein
MLIQNNIFTAEPQRAQRRNLLFGGEPFDKFKALSKVEGMPPNKNTLMMLTICSVVSKTDYL